MAFDAVIFGSFVVGTGFTDGSSISEGGFRVFIKPTANIGANPLDVTITYVDQFGNPAETTVVSTSVPAYTTSGTRIQVVLNSGDSGIRDITAVSVVGGTTGDQFNLESWNEGLGKSLGYAKQNWNSFSSEPLSGYNYNRILFATAKLKPDFYPASNPQIPQAILIKTACPRAAPGYPEPPCSGGDFLPITLSGQEHTGKLYLFIRALWDFFLPITLSGQEFNSKTLSVLHGWSESLVGFVLSGFVRDQDENIIQGIKVIITSTYREGFDQTGAVVSTSGFYQVFIKNTKYDGRILVVPITAETFDVAYRKYGTPSLIDGTDPALVSPQDLHFYKPPHLCRPNIVCGLSWFKRR